MQHAESLRRREDTTRADEPLCESCEVEYPNEDGIPAIEQGEPPRFGRTADKGTAAKEAFYPAEFKHAAFNDCERAWLIGRNTTSGAVSTRSLGTLWRPVKSRYRLSTCIVPRIFSS
jgi:hypothetical protein